MNKMRLFARFTFVFVKSHQLKGNNKKVMTNISPIMTSIGCPEK